MAEIRPLKAWRYNENLSKNISELTSPLFDVISDSQREKLYQNPFNSIHISVPEGESPAQTGLETLTFWKKNHIILQDPLPGIYIYYQYFTLPNSSRSYCRKGFICNIKAHFWEENQVLRHENTIPGSVGDRLSLLETTLLNSSATHGLYTDEDFELEVFMDEAILSPIYETEDYQGVRDVLSVIHDAKVIKKFVEKIQKQKIILADGHHRYESSLALRKSKMDQNQDDNGEEAYHFHLMYLSNIKGNDICILPTHRLLSGLENFDKGSFMEKISLYFDIHPLDNPYTLEELISNKKWTFGLILDTISYKISLKPSVFSSISWNFPEEIKQLDLTVLHYFVIEKVLGISGKAQRESKNLNFSRSLSECIANVFSHKSQIAFITKSVTIEEVEKICHTGYTMPQKSTYFYPKVICGFLFSSIEEHEFSSPNCFSI